MKRMRIMGLCLVAVFAMSAVMASGAAASPEYKTCIKAAKVGKTTPSGTFEDNLCTTGKEKAGGKYKLGAWNEGKKKFATKTSGGPGANYQYNPATNEIVGATECSSEKGVGEVVNGTTATVKNEYKGCKTPTGKNCNSPTKKKGVIVTELLAATLIGQPGSSEGVGVIVTNAGTPGGTLSAYECEGLKITAKGAVMGELTGGGTVGAVKIIKEKFGFAANETYQKFGYFGQTPAQSEASFMSFWGTGSPVPNALISSLVEGLGSPFTLPATQVNETSVKGEAFKIA
jgi:hypothetical protein